MKPEAKAAGWFCITRKFLGRFSHWVVRYVRYVRVLDLFGLICSEMFDIINMFKMFYIVLICWSRVGAGGVQPETGEGGGESVGRSW